MLIANFTNYGEEITVDGLWQYDYGQRLQINGLNLPDVFEVHLFWKGLEEAKVVTGYTENNKFYVDIPNESLKQRQAITVYIYLSTPETGKTVNTVMMFVNKRPEPEGFEIPEDIDLFHHTLTAVGEYTRQTKEAAHMADTRATESESWAHGHKLYPERDKDNAKYYADQAKQSASDAEASKQVATQSEQNINNTVTAFDNHVEEKKSEAGTAINKVKDAAVKAVTDQQSTSVQSVKDQTASYITEKETSAKTEIGNYTSEKITEIDKKASEANITLTNTITDGNSLKTQLETTISTADTSKKNLDASNTAATKTKADLDTSNTTASETKTGLDATNKTAAGLVTSLGDKISEGTQVKNDIQTTGETAMSNLQAEAAKQQEYIKASIDDTLSISGKAADAAVTGKKISWLKEHLANKITKFYASNQGETHITDSDNGKIQDMMIYGRSSQSTTTGKNLLKYPYITADGMAQGIIFTDNKDGSISVSGTATGVAYYNLYSNIDGKFLTLASGTYKLVVKGRSKCNVIASNSISTATNEGTFTITDGHNEIYCYITVQEGLTVDETIYPMIQLASITDESYEPYTGGIPSPSPDYPQEIKSVVNPTVKVTNEDGLKVQSVTLNNITLNSIPVSSGGNVTIDGQQYIADYVDVERGKLVKKLKSFTISDIETISTWGVNDNADNITGFYFYTSENGLPKTNNDVMTSTILRYVDGTWGGKNVGCAMSSDSYNNYAILSVPTNMLEDISSDENACTSLVKICENTNAIFFYSMASPIETDLTPEEIEAFKELVTYYPVTNIGVNSERLDGCAVFNYPISIKNGWNYIKKQLNDNRDYIYDMDIQSAEAYVNSEYAVALTELEV